MLENKLLFCATVESHIRAFHIPFLRWFKEQGFETHVAAAGDGVLACCDVRHNVCFSRNPISFQNLRAYFALKRIFTQHKYCLIHFHTPVAGFIGRLAAKASRRRGTKVFYTAHGFHFYKGAPLLNWILYYPLEKRMARHTDVLILLNEEDYQLARSKRFKAKSIIKIDGMGVDLERFKPVSVQEKLLLRQEFGFESDDFLLIYAGEFNKNKNQIFLIDAVKQLCKDIPELKLLLAGMGKGEAGLRTAVAKLGVEEHVRFIGFREDLDQVIPMCDVGVSSSRREGLPLNVIEYLACGLPALVSDIRGHRDIASCGERVWLYLLGSKDVFVSMILEQYRAGQNGRAIFLEDIHRFGNSETFGRYVEIYRQYQ